jgi:hypothetical protein
MMRQKCLEVDATTRQLNSHAVVHHLLAYVEDHLDALRSRGVFGFKSFADEVDMSGFETGLARRQVPYQALTSVSIFPSGTPGLVVVPGVAFDRAGGRLGRGKGYYDRLLTSLRAESAQFTAIGVGYEHQLLDEVPVEGHDQAVDILCLPARGLIPCKHSYPSTNSFPS